MPLHRRLPEHRSHTMDTMGIAVALAILIGIGLFAGGDRMGEGPRSGSSQIPIEQLSNIEKAGVVPYQNTGTDQTSSADSSHR